MTAEAPGASPGVAVSNFPLGGILALDMSLCVCVYSGMALIYLVTSGEYSCYGVEAVFTTAEAARVYAAAGGKKDWQRTVEVYILDDPNGEHSPERRPWQVSMWYATGDVISVGAEHHWDLDGDILDRPWVGRQDQRQPQRFAITIRAETEAQAIKAANEQRIQHIAEAS